MSFWKAIFLFAVVFSPVAAFTQIALFKADSTKEEGNYAEALNLYNEALKSKGLLSALDSGNLFMRRGICLVELYKPEEALADYFRALGIFERVKNYERTAAACINISDIYFTNKDFTSVEKYLNTALSLLQSVKDSVKVALVLNDLAGLYRETGKYQAAVAIHNKALHEYSHVMGGALLEKHLYNKGNCYESINQDSCLFYYNKAESVAISLEDSAMLSVIYSSMGDAYKSKGDFAAAIKYFNNSLLLNETFGSKEEQAVIYQNLSSLYDSLKVFDKAYFYSKKERELNEELYNTEKSKFATELSEKYESGKKDEKIKSQETENRLKSRNLLLSLIGLGLVAALAAISFANYKRKQKANIALQQQNERIERLNKQLDESNQVKSKLFSVISHDIRGPISSLYAYLQMQNMAAKNDSNEAFSYQAEQLLETLEDLLVWSKSQLHQFTPSADTVFLEPAINQVTGLLQHSVNEKQLTVINGVPENFTLHTDVNMLTIILRNVVGNAIKYSLPGSVLQIKSTKEAQHIFISISNQTDASTAAAMPNIAAPAINSEASGLGFTLIKEFAEKLGGKMSYAVSNNRVTATLSLPVA